MKKLTPVFPLLLLFFLVSCEERAAEELQFSAVAAPEWDSLFIRQQGWFGGDGIFAIPMSGIEYQEVEDSTENLILFSDTMIGEFEGDSLLPGYHMVNNSVALMKGKTPLEKNIRFRIYKDSTETDKAVFVPELDSTVEGEYYWLGDGFVNPADKHIYIFAYRVVNDFTKDVFQFAVLGSALIRIPPGDRFPFPNHTQVEMPFFSVRGDSFGSLGAGILVNTKSAGMPNPDGYIYIYGIDDPGKKLLAARVLPEQLEDYSAWRFWDGTGWNEDYGQSAAIVDKVSNELSVSPLPNGKYALVFSVNGVAAKTGMRIGDSPVGPFGPIQEIWDGTDVLAEKEFFAYNAKAHPSLSRPGELLISFNVNSFDFWNQIGDYPHLYRPRFFRLVYE